MSFEMRNFTHDLDSLWCCYFSQSDLWLFTCTVSRVGEGGGVNLWLEYKIYNIICPNLLSHHLPWFDGWIKILLKPQFWCFVLLFRVALQQSVISAWHEESKMSAHTTGVMNTIFHISCHYLLVVWSRMRNWSNESVKLSQSSSAVLITVKHHHASY